ncbi:hypothetical protein [Natronosalvus halobius]|uniref:hypothetical protein n=1 Tax=Natronosalvus halobius TaxID=2953746 RepID=UPI00209D3DBD|nr:hypothetical protein [Natronosalvus halobius]USZ73747.1 hypothetical protein NGM15_18595 [Natronosalvus halobius]
MIVCEHHQRPECLEIVDATLERDGDDIEVKEHYECRLEGLEGTYHYLRGVETVRGSIVATGELPRTIHRAKREGIRR